MTTEKVTVLDVPGVILPDTMPTEGSAPGDGSPLINTLLGTNDVPAGMVSVRLKAALKLPVLLTVIL